MTSIYSMTKQPYAIVNFMWTGDFAVDLYQCSLLCESLCMYVGRNSSVLCMFCDREMLLLTFGELVDVVLMLLHTPGILWLRSKYTTVTAMEYCIT